MTFDTLTQDEIDEYRSLTIEEKMARVPRSKHPMTGKRGPVYVDPHGETHVRQNAGEDIVRGHDRKGIKADDFLAEAVFENESTCPLFEVPRVVIDTMRIENQKLTVSDLCVYWLLFANARLNGFNEEMHTIPVSVIGKYLGVRSLNRIIEMLTRLGSGESTASYHFNQEGHHGRKSMKLVDIIVPSGTITGRDEITYSFPAALRTAVLESRDYGWVPINALTRFKSKFTFFVYLKMCLKAGHLAEVRTPFAVSESKFAVLSGIPDGIGHQKLNERIDLVVEDLRAISGPRRRFDIQFERFIKKGVQCVRFIAGTAARKLREVKPCDISTGLAKMFKAQPFIKKEWMPHTTRLRQASTLANVRLSDLFTAWWTDIWGAERSGDDVAGLEGGEFIRWLDRLGPDLMLEHWVEKRDFGDKVRNKVLLAFKAARDAEKAEVDAAKSPFVGTVVASPTESSYVYERSEPDEVDEFATYDGSESPYDDAPVILKTPAEDDEDIPY